jgi:tight adherence protein C
VSQQALALLPVALLLLGTIWWARRAPRRAALATLRAATTDVRRRRATATTVGDVPSVPGLAPAHLAATRDSLWGDLVEILARAARRISPPAYGARVERRLTLAGWGAASGADRFFAARLLTIAAAGPTFAVLFLLGFKGVPALLAFIVIVAVFGLGPEALLNHRVEKRQDGIRSELPGMIELLMISVEAGLGFDQALARAVTSSPGALADEFSRYLGEVRVGASQREALEAIDRRTDVAELRSFLMALVQAETFGISVGSILRSQAESARTAQRQHVQERAQKAPVKMLFPLVFCVLPALFIVVAGPAAIEIYRTFAK